jgi:hypothetical protein
MTARLRNLPKTLLCLALLWQVLMAGAAGQALCCMDPQPCCEAVATQSSACTACVPAAAVAQRLHFGMAAGRPIQADASPSAEVAAPPGTIWRPPIIRA